MVRLRSCTKKEIIEKSLDKVFPNKPTFKIGNSYGLYRFIMLIIWRQPKEDVDIIPILEGLDNYFHYLFVILRHFIPSPFNSAHCSAIMSTNQKTVQSLVLLVISVSI